MKRWWVRAHGSSLVLLIGEVAGSQMGPCTMESPSSCLAEWNRS